MLLMS